jgi:hypothetical protein
MGRTPPRLNKAYWGRGYKWLSIADLKGKIVSNSKEEITALAASTMTIIPKGSLLMSFKLSLGRLCFAGCDLFTNEAICSFNQLQASPEFVYYILGRTDFALYGKQAVKGYTLNKESLKLIEVQLPPLPEQTAIAEVLSEMDAELAGLEQRREKTRALIITALEKSSLVLERHVCKSLPPLVLLRKGHPPQLAGTRVGNGIALLALLHIHRVNPLSVRRVGETDLQLPRIALRLRHAFRQLLAPSLRLHHRQLGVLIDQHVVRDLGLPLPPAAFVRPGVMWYSRMMRLPSTTPQPAALSAGSMCSARVSASFMDISGNRLPIP